jgi:hypothetical protein
MKSLYAVLGLGLMVCLTGCQAMIYGTASKFNDLSIGMSKDEVESVLGKPVETLADGTNGEEYLIYKKMKHAISEWPRTYKVTLKYGKVSRWDEQYDEKNVNNF